YLMRRVLCALVVPLLGLSAARGQAPFPKVEEGEWKPVRQQGRRLLQTLRTAEGALPAGLEKKLAAVLEEDAADGGKALAKLQELLDPLCLVGVSINPESRVK